MAEKPTSENPSLSATTEAPQLFSTAEVEASLSAVRATLPEVTNPGSYVVPYNPKDPYFLNSSDQPGNLITPVVFTGQNFSEWSRAVELSLTARRKITFLEGTEIKPVHDPSRLLDWRVVQALLLLSRIFANKFQCSRRWRPYGVI